MNEPFVDPVDVERIDGQVMTYERQTVERMVGARANNDDSRLRNPVDPYSRMPLKDVNGGPASTGSQVLVRPNAEKKTAIADYCRDHHLALPQMPTAQMPTAHPRATPPGPAARRHTSGDRFGCSRAQIRPS
jgi:hypothetical protein